MPKCPGCYSNYNGHWWCDNCDLWPCVCLEEENGECDGAATKP